MKIQWETCFVRRGVFAETPKLLRPAGEAVRSVCADELAWDVIETY